jgi:hypothetical protein
VPKQASGHAITCNERCIVAGISSFAFQARLPLLTHRNALFYDSFTIHVSVPSADDRETAVPPGLVLCNRVLLRLFPPFLRTA